jgi:hypothetical protein
MPILQIDLHNKKQVRDFLDLPFRLYKDDPYWVPPLDSDARDQLDPQKHPFYKHSQAAFFAAVKDQRTVGRIAILDNRPFNEYNQTQIAFFNLFECEHDSDTARALFDAAIAWSRSRGLTTLRGPHGFSALDGNGFLVSGFDRIPPYGMAYNPKYYIDIIESLGFQPNLESVSGVIGSDWKLDPRVHELSERVQKRRGLHVARYKTKKDLMALVPHFKELYNGSLGGTRENAPITDEEVNSIVSQVLMFADPKLVKIVKKDDRMVGFLLAYPNITRGLQAIRGKLFPFGWIRLMLDMKRTDWIDLNGAGMIDEYRGVGGTAILFSEMEKSVRESGQFKQAYVVQIGVENERMQREMREMGIDFCMMHRTYEKNL